MDLESVKKSLEDKSTSFDPLHRNLYNSFILNALRVDLVEPHRVLCSLIAIPRLRNDGNYMHGGVIATLVDLVGSAVFFAAGYSTSGVSLELNVSHFDAAFVGDEIEIEAKLLHGGKAAGVTSVEIRKKKTGKLIAQGRHTKYLAVSSKL